MKINSKALKVKKNLYNQINHYEMHPVVVVDTMAIMKFRLEYEIAPIVPLRLKIEINCREYFAELGWENKDFSIQSNWCEGKCPLATYKVEELLGTKIRALHQRRKGHDL